MNKLMKLALFAVLLSGNILYLKAFGKDQQQTIAQEAKEVFELLHDLKLECLKKYNSSQDSRLETCNKEALRIYEIALKSFENKYKK